MRFLIGKPKEKIYKIYIIQKGSRVEKNMVQKISL